MAGELIKFKHGNEVLHVDHTPSADVAGGDVVVVDLFPFIAERPIPADQLGAVAARGGVHEGISDGTVDAGGAKIYLAAGKLSAAGVHMGYTLPDQGATVDGDRMDFIFAPDGTVGV